MLIVSERGIVVNQFRQFIFLSDKMSKRLDKMKGEVHAIMQILSMRTEVLQKLPRLQKDRILLQEFLFFVPHFKNLSV